MREPYHKLEDKLVGSDNRMNIRYSDIRNSKHQQQVFDRQGMRKPYRITGDYKRSFWVSYGKLKKLADEISYRIIPAWIFKSGETV